jgi:hypothetical protein
MWPAILKMSAARLMTSTGYSSRESAPDGIFGNDSIHAMYVDKLDGKVDGVFFERMSVEWRAEQDRCLWEIERHQSADESYLEEGIRILELARNAQRSPTRAA